MREDLTSFTMVISCHFLFLFSKNLEYEKDITANVVKSLDLGNASKQAMLNSLDSSFIMRRVLSVFSIAQGSYTYKALAAKDKGTVYPCFVLKKEL